MNILPFSIEKGEYSDRYYHTEFLKLCASANCTFIEKPTNEFYFVAGEVHRFTYNNIITNINEQIKTDLQNNKAKIILYADIESFNVTIKKGRNVLQLFDEIASIFQIDKQNIIYVDCNYKIEKALAMQKLNGFYNNFWETFFSIPDSTEVENNITNKKIRDKKFLFFGGKARDYRLRFVDVLSKLPNFESDSYFSNQSGTYNDPKTNQNIFVKSRVLDLPELSHFDLTSEDDAISFNVDLHTNSYLNIIPMSYFHSDHTHLEINEKLFKPICSLQPFIILGERGTLQALKEMGYQTFDKWIDESYDNELDDETRFNKVVNEITKLNNMSYDDLANMLLDMLPVLTYNLNLNKSKKDNLVNEKYLTNKLLSYTIT
jgi:hypothetical protein